jgi:putative flippase GtrA
MGTVAGGVVNFLLGRLWVFNARDHEKSLQVMRYVIIWAGSLIINTLGVFLLTEVLKMHYLLSKALISITVGVMFNFYFQKSFVFKI